MKKADKKIIANRLDNARNMVAEIQILNKRYPNTKNEKVNNLYWEKCSYLDMYLDDIEEFINGGDK